MLINVLDYWIHPELITSVSVLSTYEKDFHCAMIWHGENQIKGEWLANKEIVQLEVNELAERINKALKVLQ